MVAAALTLVETEGPAALTMRRLAAELDVTTTTVYWHVGRRDELITDLIRRQSERQAARPITGSTPRERVMCAAHHVWDSALEHRAITSLAHQTGTTSLLEHPLEVALVRELEAAGLTGSAAAEAMRAVLSTVGGFLVLALRDQSAIPEERRGPALWAAADAGLDPHTVAATLYQHGTAIVHMIAHEQQWTRWMWRPLRHVCTMDRTMPRAECVTTYVA